jgi:hypothetical protein
MWWWREKYFVLKVDIPFMIEKAMFQREKETT